MGKTSEELDQLLKLVRDEDVATLRALERQLRSLVEEKERDEARERQDKAARELLSEQGPHVPIDPDLLSLVGIHPENPVQDDKAIIAEAIARRMTD